MVNVLCVQVKNFTSFNQQSLKFSLGRFYGVSGIPGFAALLAYYCTMYTILHTISISIDISVLIKGLPIIIVCYLSVYIICISDKAFVLISIW